MVNKRVKRGIALKSSGQGSGLGRLDAVNFAQCKPATHQLVTELCSSLTKISALKDRVCKCILLKPTERTSWTAGFCWGVCEAHEQARVAVSKWFAAIGAAARAQIDYPLLREGKTCNKEQHGTTWNNKKQHATRKRVVSQVCCCWAWRAPCCALSQVWLSQSNYATHLMPSSMHQRCCSSRWSMLPALLCLQKSRSVLLMEHCHSGFLDALKTCWLHSTRIAVEKRLWL